MSVVANESLRLDVEEGDFVEHRANPDVYGVVIGFEGSLVIIRLSPSLATVRYHEYELRAIDDDEYDGPDDVAAERGNVINFTKAVELRRDTRTEGVA